MSDVDTLLELGRDVWAVACNYREATKAARKGARALVIASSGAGMGYERVEVVARSRGGRLVQKWEDIRRLDNFRATCIPAGHPARDPQHRRAGLFLPGKMAADEHADALAKLARRDRTERPRGDGA